MALQTVSPFAWPGMCRGLGSSAAAVASTVTLDAAGEYFSVVINAREAMNISHVGILAAAVAGSPVADITIETVDGTTGLPSGTLWNSGTTNDSSRTTGTLVANTLDFAALTGATGAIAAGQDFAVKIAYNSGTSLSPARIANTFGLVQKPYLVQNTGAAAKASFAALYGIVLGSAATTFYHIPGIAPVTTVTNSTFNNTSSAKRGVRFQVPYKCRAAGLRWFFNTSGGDVNYGISDDSGTELSSSSTANDGTNLYTSGTNGAAWLWFDNPVTLSPGTWYRAWIEPSSATNSNITVLTLPGADYRGAMPGGTNFFYTTYVASSWTDTATDQVPLVDLLIDQLDDGAGGGSGGILRHPGMLGGLVG